MTGDVIAASRAIPVQLAAVVTSMFEESSSALREAVAGLKTSLSKVQRYVDSVEVPPAKAGRKPGVSASTSAEVPTVTRRRRKSGRFPISTFVLNELRNAGKAMRPVELAARLSEKTGRAKESAMANINTLLSRLRQAKKVTSKNGLYSATGSAQSATTSIAPPKTTGKRRQGKKFMIGEFIVTTLTKNSKGMRPVDLAKLVAEAAPGRHKDTQSITSTTLARLRQQKHVANKNGVWTAVKK